MSLNNVARIAVRQLHSTARRENSVPEGYKQLKNIQQHFQAPNGKPVHLKGGPMDAVLYYSTMGLSVVGIGCIGKLIWDLSWPKPVE